MLLLNTEQLHSNVAEKRRRKHCGSFLSFDVILYHLIEPRHFKLVRMALIYKHGL